MSPLKKTPRAGKKIHAAKKPTAKTPMKRPVTAVKRQSSANKPSLLRRLHLGMHLAIAGSAIAVLMLLGVVDRATFSTGSSKAESTMPATIGVEHDDPLSLSVLVAKKEKAGYVSLTNRSDAAIHVSVPSDWQRSEVTGAPLSAVVSDIPVFGFTRWSLPAHAGIKMLLAAAPDSLFFDSASKASTAVDLQTVDLTTLHVSSRVVLLQNQLLVPLWDYSQQ